VVNAVSVRRDDLRAVVGPDLVVDGRVVGDVERLARPVLVFEVELERLPGAVEPGGVVVAARALVGVEDLRRRPGVLGDDHAAHVTRRVVGERHRCGRVAAVAAETAGQPGRDPDGRRHRVAAGTAHVPRRRVRTITAVVVFVRGHGEG